MSLPLGVPCRNNSVPQCIFQGGMKAVLWTDVFQIGMMFAGLIAVLIRGSMDFGGFSNIWDIVDKGQRIEFFK